MTEFKSTTHSADTAQAHGVSISAAGIKSPFLPTPGEPALKWNVWYQMFTDHLVATGLDSVPEARKLAILRSSLGTEGYRICAELCTPDTTYNDTVRQLESRFAPKQSAIYSRAQFNRRLQGTHETCLEYATALRALAGKCNYADAMREELIRDRLVAGCRNDRLRERLLMEPDTLTLEQALTISQNFERATTESSTVARCTPSDNVQALGAKKVFKARGRSKSRQSRERSTSPGGKLRYQPRAPACYKCGNPFIKPHKCPAFNVKCNTCGKMGHFAKCCKGRSYSKLRRERATSPRAETNMISTISRQEDGVLEYVRCSVGEKDTSLLIDSGAKVSLLNIRYVNSLPDWHRFSTSSLQLTTYTGAQVKVIGILHLSVKYRGVRLDSFPFHIVQRGSNLMGKDLFDALGFNIRAPGPPVLSAIHSDKQLNPIAAKFPQIFEQHPGKVIKDFYHKPTIDHTIPLVMEPLRRIPLAYQEKALAELKRMEADGILEKIDSSPSISNMVIAPKPNDAIRICADLRNPNKAIIPDKYPLPTMEELSEFFAGATVFSKIDLKWGYLQIPLAKESRYLTGMITPFGLYQWTRVPFGLCSAPSCFQKIISKMIEGCKRTKNLLDDIVVCGANKQEHDANLQAVLNRLSQHNATVNGEKCQFGVAEIEFAGHHISTQGVRPLQSNVEALLAIEKPTNIKDVHSFLSTAAYYMKFVPHFAEITEPLRVMLKKDATFDWTQACQEAFDKVKQEITSDRVLAHFDPYAQTIVSTDASGIALGAVLSQIQYGIEVPIAFASRALQPAERAYSVGEREALACIWACERWHYYLYGRRFTLRTDHSALTALLGASTKGRKPMRLMRWADRLHQYNYTVVYRPGKENSVADMLSRAVGSSGTDESTCETSADLSMISTIFGSTALRAMTPADIATETGKDQTLTQLLENISTGWPKRCTQNMHIHPFHQVKEDLTTANGCVFRDTRVVVPASLQKKVLELAHEGHCGIVKAKQRLRECVWWPGIDKEIEHFVRSCTACAISNKSQRSLPTPPLEPVKYPTKPWSVLAIDILGELHGVPPQARYLIVVYDLHSKWPEVKAVPNITTHAVNSFLSELFARWGIPERIISDNGRQFVSKDFENFCAELNIKHSKTALYHPQSNGAVERFNRVLKEGIRADKHEARPFADTLRSILANYRSTCHATTGVTPAELMIGRRMRMPLDLLSLKPPKRHVHFGADLRAHVQQKQTKYKAYADDRRRAKPSNLQPGDMVRFQLQNRQSKLDPVWSPPRRVVSKPSTYTATLEDGSTWNADKLMRACSPHPQNAEAGELICSSAESSEQTEEPADQQWSEPAQRADGEPAQRADGEPAQRADGEPAQRPNRDARWTPRRSNRIAPPPFRYHDYFMSSPNARK